VGTIQVEFSALLLLKIWVSAGDTLEVFALLKIWGSARDTLEVFALLKIWGNARLDGDLIIMTDRQ
jgi:hypothetical protein